MACFHNLALREVRALTQLDVFTRRDLTLFLNFLTLDFIAHLVAISERVVFADFAEEVSIANLCCDERLFKLEAFFLDALRQINLDIGLVIS